MLLSGSEDNDIQQYFIRNAFPREDLVSQILEVLEASERGLTLRAIGKGVNGKRREIEAAIAFLAAEFPAPILKQHGRYLRTLGEYKLPHERIRRVLATKQAEWRDMQAYLKHPGCLMEYLAAALDDHDTGPCGRCGNCLSEPPLPPTYERHSVVAAVKFQERVEIEIPPKTQAEWQPNVAQCFATYAFPASVGALAHETGRALCKWGEAGLGKIAVRGSAKVDSTRSWCRRQPDSFANAGGRTRCRHG